MNKSSESNLDHIYTMYMYLVILFGIKVSKGIKQFEHPSVRPREICLGSQGSSVKF